MFILSVTAAGMSFPLFLYYWTICLSDFFGLALSAIRNGFLYLSEVFVSADAKKVCMHESSLCCYFTLRERKIACTRSNCWDELPLFSAHCIWFMVSAVSTWQSCLQSTAESNILAGYFKMLDTFIATGIWSCNCSDKSAAVCGVQNLTLPSKYHAARLG